MIKKIEARTEKMFNDGVKNEVVKFFELKIKKNKSANKIIGVYEINEYLKKKLSITQVKDLIKIRTRQYAKRQNTWARGKMSSWNTINGSNYKKILKIVAK